MKFRFTLWVLALAIITACSAPSPLKRDLKVETILSPPIEIKEDIISSEPVIFVRGFSLTTGGARDLDDILEKKLAAARHRLSSRSAGAKIKVIARLVYLGNAKGINVERTLQSKFQGQIVRNSDTETYSHRYQEIAVVDLKVTTQADGNDNIQTARVVSGALYPTPEMTKEDLRAALLDGSARQIAVIFSF